MWLDIIGIDIYENDQGHFSTLVPYIYHETNTIITFDMLENATTVIKTLDTQNIGYPVFGISNVSVVSKAEPLFWGKNFYFKGSMCNTYLQFPSKPWRGSKRPCSDCARRNYDPKRKIGGRSPARFGGGHLRRRVQFFARHRNKSRPFIRLVRQTENRKRIKIRCRRIFAGQSATWT